MNLGRSFLSTEVISVSWQPTMTRNWRAIPRCSQHRFVGTSPNFHHLSTETVGDLQIFIKDFYITKIIHARANKNCLKKLYALEQNRKIKVIIRIRPITKLITQLHPEHLSCWTLCHFTFHLAKFVARSEALGPGLLSKVSPSPPQGEEVAAKWNLWMDPLENWWRVSLMVQLTCLYGFTADRLPRKHPRGNPASGGRNCLCSRRAGSSCLCWGRGGSSCLRWRRDGRSCLYWRREAGPALAGRLEAGPAVMDERG